MLTVVEIEIYFTHSDPYSTRVQSVTYAVQVPRFPTAHWVKENMRPVGPTSSLRTVKQNLVSPPVCCVPSFRGPHTSVIYPGSHGRFGDDNCRRPQ